MNQNSSYSAPPQTPASPPPIRRVLAAKTGPEVTYALLGITVFVYFLQMSGPFLFGSDLVASLGEKNNALILQGQLWRLFTPMFLHGSILHIGFNMYALYIFGPGLERHFGHSRFLALYLISGFAGNVISFLFSPYRSLGSSTAIFGLIAAEGVFLYQNRSIFGSVAQKALVNIIVVAGINLVIGLSPGIDNWGHVGGLLAGLIFTWYGGPLLQNGDFIPGAYAVQIVDARETGDVIRAGLSVSLLFAALAAYKIFMG